MSHFYAEVSSNIILQVMLQNSREIDRQNNETAEVYMSVFLALNR